MGHDDQDQIRSVLKRKRPNLSDRTIDIIVDRPESTYCLVISLNEGENPVEYTGAIAIIRAEHPDLIRLSCVHEELAQGLGLANDSPQARPSIFNDDDEFALLTSHDEKLLAMLYDPRLRAGMDAATARPVARILARELMGQEL